MRWLRHPLVQDALVAAALLAVELPFVHHAPPLVLVGELAIGVAIALRRRFTFVAGVVFAVAFIVQPLAMSDPPEGALAIGAVLLLGYAFGSRFRWPVAVAGLGILSVGTLGHETFESGDYAFAAALTMFAWLCGVLVHAARNESQLLRRRSEAAESERMADVAAARAVERTRIARELHDIVSHGVTAMMVQNSAARELLHRNPALAAQAMDEVRSAGEATMVELHQLLRLLRDAQQQPSGAVVLPGIADLPTLVERARGTGTHVDLALHVQRSPLPMPVELSVYRLVQEGLTNARRHSPGSRVQVTVGDRGDCITVCVEDFRPSAPTPPSAGASRGDGLGLIGLRERIDVLGGSLAAGPTPTGFVVRAELPTSSEAA